MNEGKKVGIIGLPNAGTALSIAQEVQRVEIANRRKLMDVVIKQHIKDDLFRKFLGYSQKELKKRTKGFSLIMRHIEGLNLGRYFESTATPTPTQAHRISVAINSLISAKSFTELDLEKTDTDYFQLLVGLYICMKSVTANFMKLYPKDKRVHELTWVSSEVGLRLYSLYIDTRKEDTRDYEEVRLR